MMQHCVAVDEAVGRALTQKRHRCLGEATIIRGQGHAEGATSFETGTGSASGDGSRLVNGAEFLRVPLEVPPHEREVLVDPDEEAPTVETILVATAHDDEGLLVLSAHGTEQSRAVVATAWPVGPDKGDGTGILVVVRERNTFGQERGDRRGVRAVLHREERSEERRVGKEGRSRW